MEYLCEMCDSNDKAMRRSDNIYVCNKCDTKHIDLDFKESLDIGKDKEKYVKGLFKKHFYAIYDNDDYRFDLAFLQKGNYITMEVKYDDMVIDTGNFAVEFESRGNPSGIKTTHSDFWAFVDTDNVVYLLYTSMIKKLCMGKKEIQTRCKDSHNKVYLLPKKEIIGNCIGKKHFTELI